MSDAAGSATGHEIASQPDVWRHALALEAATLAALPERGESVLALGCGTSYYVLDAYARRRQALTGDITRAAIASELDELVAYDRVLMLSRSGTTGELLLARAQLPGSARVVALCGTPGARLIDVVDDAVLLPFADERSVVQTRFASTALLVLRRSIGDDVDALPEAAAVALSDGLPIDPAAARHVVFLGSGWTLGIAHEAALKCREAALLAAEAHAVGEYRHGPIAAAGPETLVWSLTPLPPDTRRAIDATGAQIEECCRDPLAELVRIHRFALGAALAAGLDPDSPPHLNRSVVLP